MGFQSKIAASMESGGIERILVIDDAFDAPLANAEMAAGLAEILNGEDAPELVAAGLFDRDGLLQSEAEGRFDDEELQRFVQAAYDRFASTGDPRWDVGGRFKALKSASLDVLRPLLEILRSCDAVSVVTAGLRNAEQIATELHPHLIFLDFFLSPPGSLAEDDVRDRGESLNLLRRLTDQEPGAVPAVVLMSSKAKEARSTEFRRDADLRPTGDHSPKVLQWRFHFLDKNLIRRVGEAIEVQPDAADALLDASQSYRFGTELHRALDEWRSGARKAVDALTRDIAELDIKDFAYLTRFRLREEGITLSEYLEWLFGENLLDQVSRSVTWTHEAFTALDDGSEALIAPIEGAYDGPTARIASMFGRARIQDASLRRRPMDLRMGDLFRIADTDLVKAVLTPDCDLVVRDGQRAVRHVLTVEGRLRSFDEPTHELTDFLVGDDGRPAVIAWRRKELETIDFSADQIRSRGGGLQYIGTLRPLYALDLQRSVLNDVARIGLAVAPVIGMSASAKVLLDTPTGSIEQDVGFDSKAVCTIMPPRGGKDAYAKILFYRSFVHAIVTAVRAMPAEAVKGPHAEAFNRIREKDGEDVLYDRLCIQGVRLGQDRVLGVSFSAKRIKGTEMPWLQVVLRLVETETWAPSDANPDEGGSDEGALAGSGTDGPSSEGGEPEHAVAGASATPTTPLQPHAA